MIFPGTMHNGRHINLFCKCNSSTFTKSTESKQKKFSDKNYQLQKLIHIILHIYVAKRVVILF